MSKKHFSDNQADRRGGRNGDGPGGFGRRNDNDNDRPGPRGGDRPDNRHRPPTNGAFGNGPRPGGEGGERRSYGPPRQGGSGGFGGGRPAERRDDRPGKEQRSGTGYGRSAPEPRSYGSREQYAGRDERGGHDARRPAPDGRPVRPYQPRENWPGQPYRQEGRSAVPRGEAGERNRKFQKQNPNEDRPASQGPGFGRSTAPDRGGERRDGQRDERSIRDGRDSRDDNDRDDRGRRDDGDGRDSGSSERGPNRPIRSARPFSATPPEGAERRDQGSYNDRNDRTPRNRDERRGYEPDQAADEAAFGRRFTAGAFGKRETNFNPRHPDGGSRSQGERPGGFASPRREGERPRLPGGTRPGSEGGDWAGGSNAPTGPGKGTFGQRREALKATERSERRSGTGYGSGRDERPAPQANRADKPRFGERPGEAPDYKNLKHYEDDKMRGNKRRRQEDQDFGTDELRLNRYIANAGICSRREADSLIAAGEIRVNGEVVTEMGYKVQPEDTVQYGKTNLSREKSVYVLLNKPKDFITTTEDPEGRRTVMDLVASASKERIFPVGRLDRNTTGLLLFTNDGEMAQKLSHPSHKNKKIYQVELATPLTEDHLRQISDGLELEDGKALVDDVAVVAGNPHFVGIEIHIGRNRIVRRIFEHLGYDVVALDRVQYAGLTKKDLPRGKWRFLNEQEVIRLKYFL